VSGQPVQQEAGVDPRATLGVFEKGKFFAPALSGFESWIVEPVTLVETCVLLRYYAASSGNFLPTFRDNLSVPSSGVNNPRHICFDYFKVMTISTWQVDCNIVL